MSSLVWTFFDKPNNSNDPVTCSLCKVKLQYKGSTSGLLKHIRSCHPDTYKRQTKESSQEPTRKKTCEREYPDETPPETFLTRSFCTGLIPFRFAANKEFRQFTNALDPNFHVPSPQQIRSLIDRENDNYIDSLNKELKSVKEFVLITDGFSDFKKAYNFYSAHLVFIDSKFRRHTKFIGIRQVDESSTTEGISRTLIGILDTAGQSMLKCVATVTDGAPNVKSVSSWRQIDNLHCSCHVLNLVMKDFSKMKAVNNLLEKSQNLARFLMRNKECRKELQRLASTSNDTVPLPTPLPETRWAYMYSLFKSYKTNYGVIASCSQLQEFLLSPKQFDTLTKLVELLQPLHKSIRDFESDDSFISDIIPTFDSLREDTEEKGGRYAKDLAILLKDRMKEYLSNKICLASCIADPRSAFAPDMLLNKTWDDAIEAFKSYRIEPSEPVVAPTHGQEAKTGVGAYLKKKFSAGSTLTNNLDTEILKYKACLITNRPDHESNPLHFWSSQASNFPEMSKISKRILCIPASSAASERLFSKCSDIVGQRKRNRIKTTTMNAILMTAALSKQQSSETDERYAYVDEDNYDDDFYDDDDDLLDESLNLRSTTPDGQDLIPEDDEALNDGKEDFQAVQSPTYWSHEHICEQGEYTDRSFSEYKESSTSEISSKEDEDNVFND